MDEGKYGVGILGALRIFAQFTSAAAIAVLPWLIGVLFAYPTALAGTLDAWPLLRFARGCHALTLANLAAS
jgi:hypothetical protein